MSAPELSAEELATVERFEAAPAAEESLRLRVAEAMWQAEAAHSLFVFPCRCGWSADFGAGWESRGNRHRRLALADAAIAVLRGPSSDAERAVERVVALADFHAECCEYVKVRDLRAAVAGQ